MTTTELIEKLKEYHEEELADKRKYCELAATLEKDDRVGFACVLRDIADEEETHAHLIKDMLKALKEGEDNG